MYVGDSQNGGHAMMATGIWNHRRILISPTKIFIGQTPAVNLRITWYTSGLEFSFGCRRGSFQFRVEGLWPDGLTPGEQSF